MKKNIILLFLLMVCISDAFAQNKKFDKLIAEYDVKQFINDVDINNYGEFWLKIRDNNEQYQKYKKASQKGTEAAANARIAINKAEAMSADYYLSLPVLKDEDWTNIANSIKDFLGLGSGLKLSIIESDEENAFTTPSGQIYICDALLLTDSLELKNIIGIAAHEVAHYVLQHSLVEAYAEEKKLQKNNVAAAIASGVNAAANAYAQANGAVGDESWESVNKTTYSLFEAAKKDARERYRFKYSREQEIEADIVAYRFLEMIGIGGECYINALKYLGHGDTSMKTSKDSTHPAMQFRIELLEYLHSKK